MDEIINSLRGRSTATATASAEESLKLYTITDPSPEYLYHYTSPRGLIDIVKSGKMFATNVRYLNDSSEYIYAHELFYGRLGAWIEEADEPQVISYLKYVQESAHAGTLASISATDGDIYVVSFSADGDVLSQWRGYCPPEGGYSIGFSLDALRDAARTKIGLFPGAWRLIKCEYKGEAQIRTIDHLISSSVEEFLQIDKTHDNALSSFLDGNSKEDRPELLRLIANEKLALRKIAPILKDGAFDEEEEWHLVSPAIIDGDPSIQFREGDTSVVPFVYFRLPGNEAAPVIDDLIVGPAINQALSRRAAEQLCDVSIAKTSKIPYRHLR